LTIRESEKDIYPEKLQGLQKTQEMQALQVSHIEEISQSCITTTEGKDIGTCANAPENDVCRTEGATKPWYSILIDNISSGLSMLSMNTEVEGYFAHIK
jgi:hypothetical protein